MEVYQHEQEQIEALKQWWKQHGSLFLTVFTVILLVSGAWRFWQYRERSHQSRAAAVYQELLQARDRHDAADQHLLSTRLLSRYNDTLYAEYAALDMAKAQLLKNDAAAAKVSLQWVIEHAKHGAKNVARLRLARLFLMEKKPADALLLLDRIDMSIGRAWPNFVRGQAYFMQKKLTLAKQAFDAAQQALWTQKEQDRFVWIKQIASDRSLLNAMINTYLDQLSTVKPAYHTNKQS